MFYYIPDFLPSDIIKKKLDTTTFLSTTYDKKIYKKQLWFGPDYFDKRWTKIRDQWIPQEYPEWLSTFQNMIQNKYNKLNLSKININSCLANKYRTGVDHIKPHRDSNYSFGNEPTVLIYSIGATRKLTFTHNETKKQFSYDLEDGSLFIMNGRSQEDYTHEVPPSDTKDVRYSLTFREYIQ